MATLHPPASRSISVGAIAESIIGPIDWQTPIMGFVPCPGKELHTHRNGKRDCVVKVDGAPTIHCVHNSCAGIVAEKNRALRSEIGKAQRSLAPTSYRPWRPSPAQLQEQRERAAIERLKERASKSLPQIVAQHPMTPTDYWEASPHRLEGDGANDWRLILQLFRDDDVVWIGELHASGKREHAQNFRTAADWLKASTAPGQHVCPSAFKPGVFSRSQENVAARRFIVLESDTLPKNEFCAVVRWLEKLLWLRALVDTAGKSIHSWFNLPDAATLAELRAVLPSMGIDAAMFNPAHTCRLPGAMREGKRQHLVYLDLEAAR